MITNFVCYKLKQLQKNNTKKFLLFFLFLFFGQIENIKEMLHLLFSLSTSLVIINHSINIFKNLGYDGGLPYKQPQQKSGFYFFSFAHFLQKGAAHIYRSLYGDAVFDVSAICRGTNMVAVK